MIDYQTLEKAVELTRSKWPDAKPSHGIILGSGWGALTEIFSVHGKLSYAEIPGLGKPEVEGHGGDLLLGEFAGKETLIFHGRRHLYEGTGFTPIALPIALCKKFGVKTVAITNSSGGINAQYKPGDIMLIKDHINGMGQHPLVGPHQSMWGPRFPDQSDVYTAALQKLAIDCAAENNITLHQRRILRNTRPEL